MAEEKKKKKGLRPHLNDYVQDVNGEYQWCRVLYRAICDENGGPYLAIGKISNINLFKKEIEQLERESKTDSLTGAYNKMATRDLIDDYIKVVLMMQNEVGILDDKIKNGENEIMQLETEIKILERENEAMRLNLKSFT